MRLYLIYLLVSLLFSISSKADAFDSPNCAKLLARIRSRSWTLNATSEKDIAEIRRQIPTYEFTQFSQPSKELSASGTIYRWVLLKETGEIRNSLFIQIEPRLDGSVLNRRAYYWKKYFGLERILIDPRLDAIGTSGAYIKDFSGIAFSTVDDLMDPTVFTHEVLHNWFKRVQASGKGTPYSGWSFVNIGRRSGFPIKIRGYEEFYSHEEFFNHAVSLGHMLENSNESMESIQHEIEKLRLFLRSNDSMTSEILSYLEKPKVAEAIGAFDWSITNNGGVGERQLMCLFQRRTEGYEHYFTFSSRDLTQDPSLFIDFETYEKEWARSQERSVLGKIANFGEKKRLETVKNNLSIRLNRLVLVRMRTMKGYSAALEKVDRLDAILKEIQKNQAGGVSSATLWDEAKAINVEIRKVLAQGLY